MRKSLIIILILSFAISCIDPFTIKTGNQSGTLVVDGLLTTQSGASVVKLSRSLPFDNSGVISSYFDPERNAVISINDGDGNEILFYEAEPGTYKTDPDFAGEIGKIYTLNIQTSNGEQYSSSSEAMLSVPEIDSLFYEYLAYEELVENSNGDFVITLRFGFKILVQVSDPGSERNYYRWKVSGIYEFFSFIGERFLQCWAPVARIETGLKIQDDASANGNTFIETLGIIPYDRPTYYQVTLKQYALTADAYRFWNDVKNQQTNTGSIFDPIPSQIKGNVFNVNKPEEFVMGYFSAASVTERIVLINRRAASGFLPPSPNLEPQPGNCLDQILHATNIKPPGFP